MAREFHGSTIWEEMHGYRNVLRGVGDGTVLHAHAFPHVALFWLGSPDEPIEYDVTAIERGGSRRLEMSPLFPDLPSVRIGHIEVPAHVRHEIRLRSGDIGAFVCLFQRYHPLPGVTPRPDPMAESDKEGIA